MSEGLPALDLNELGDPPGMPGLSESKGRALAEAAAVCLEFKGHRQGASLTAIGSISQAFALQWPPATDQTRRGNADLQDATECGACGVAIRLVKEVTGLSAVEQSFKGTGFDYWIGPENSELFQDKRRLEISGILEGDENVISRRVDQKVTQTARSAELGIAAYVCVVEFSRPVACLVIA